MYLHVPSNCAGCKEVIYHSALQFNGIEIIKLIDWKTIVPNNGSKLPLWVWISSQCSMDFVGVLPMGILDSLLEPPKNTYSLSIPQVVDFPLESTKSSANPGDPCFDG
jgi:hypothetical protein